MSTYKMSNDLLNEASPLLVDEDQDTVDVSVESTQCKLLQNETGGYVELKELRSRLSFT